MIAYKNLQDLMNKTVVWERKLADLYDVAEFGVKNEKSKKLISYLKQRQADIVEVIARVDVNLFGPSEWIQFSSDYREEDLIPSKDFKRDSTPDEIFKAILEYQGKLKRFYSDLAKNLNNESQQDLFNSLVQLRDNQIDRIQNFMNAS